ncbi:ABC transporter ATP-binding protein [Hansschlegelia zhihuaiae]|uniref:ABC transporter ATP-binding protein n=1 Tax=Hansschlegelia zhihuaiae TaxID=405005 RepID=A0A4Q0MQB2_9HYPH|nr:ABC transporter ATP-binding protein [Hansschlegelia zhihuaiae]RXF75409.1 ABC transporter ATP-binding protein [Hansschlegelia zhihuaiae]
MTDDFLLETRGLTREFSGFTAVNKVDLRVRRHSIHALIGPNGAGKTTCFNLITKFLQPSSGAILLDGRDITRTKPADVARLGMVRSFQISATFPQLTSLENVEVALQRSLGRSFHFWRSKRTLAPLREQAMTLLDDVGLAFAANRVVADLPYGQKRALELATTLALNPEMLLLDEPTAGMGREDVARTVALIRRISPNRTILMVEHNLSVVADLSDRITVLARGEILAEGAYGAISTDPRVKEAYMGKGEPAHV